MTLLLWMVTPYCPNLVAGSCGELRRVSIVWVNSTGLWLPLPSIRFNLVFSAMGIYRACDCSFWGWYANSDMFSVVIKLNYLFLVKFVRVFWAKSTFHSSPILIFGFLSGPGFLVLVSDIKAVCRTDQKRCDLWFNLWFHLWFHLRFHLRCDLRCDL